LRGKSRFMGHLPRLSRSQWQPAGAVLGRHGDWVALAYAVAISVVAVQVIPNWWATNPLMLVAIGLPVIFLARHYWGAISGVVMVLIGVVWLIVLAR